MTSTDVFSCTETIFDGASRSVANFVFWECALTLKVYLQPQRKTLGNPKFCTISFITLSRLPSFFIDGGLAIHVLTCMVWKSTSVSLHGKITLGFYIRHTAGFVFIARTGIAVLSPKNRTAFLFSKPATVATACALLEITCRLFVSILFTFL